MPILACARKGKPNIWKNILTTTGFEMDGRMDGWMNEWMMTDDKEVEIIHTYAHTRWDKEDRNLFSAWGPHMS